MFSKQSEIPDATALKSMMIMKIKKWVSWNTHPVGPWTSFYACQCWESFICILKSQTYKKCIFPSRYTTTSKESYWHWCPPGRYHANENRDSISNTPEVESTSLHSSD